MFPEDLIAPAGSADTRGIDSHYEARGRFYLHESMPVPPKRRLWLHILLFLITLASTTLAGAHMQYNFSHNLPFYEPDSITSVFVWRGWPYLLGGVPFSLTLLTILMAHEMGHYFLCLYYDVDATLPFFLPSPVPVTGTFGAFIKIRSAIPSRRVLFDIGIAGPLAGFVFLLPALGVGLAFSKVLPGIGHQGSLQFGVPGLQWLAAKLVFPGVSGSDLYLHPVARAAWVGMFATAMNLLPAGQLDGGHIVYALFGRVHRWITWGFLAALVPLGLLWSGWWFWAALLFIFARKHPPVFESEDLGAGRLQLGAVALCLFVLCFCIVPIVD